MHHDVGSAAGGLVSGEGVGQFRVHHGEFAPAQVTVVPTLDAAFFLGDHAGIAHLAACRGDGEHGTDGGAARGGVLVVVQIPHVKIVGKAVADGLGRVNDATAAYRQQEIHALFAAQLDAPIDQRQPGVGLYPAQGNIGDTSLIQRGIHPVQQAAFLGALPTEVDQHFSSALFFAQLPHLVFYALAEDHLGGRLEYKLVHKTFFLSIKI